MNSQEDIWNPSQLRLEGDFEAQVNQLLMYVRLTRSEVENLQQLITDVQTTFSIPWPGCRVQTFGSIVTGLGIASSDIDCYVSLPEWVCLDSHLVYQGKSLLKSQPTTFSELFAIPMAKVPIVKCFHIPTSCYCDINFTSRAGVENSKLIAYLLHVDRRALPLAVLIKYWAKVHNLTGTNLMPNYALTMLVIFYLQNLKILPSVHSLQQTVPVNMLDGWNSAFDENQSFKSEDRLTLYELLGGFFDYYNNFDFEKRIVCTYLGQPVEKECFRQLDSVPKEFHLYKCNVRSEACQELRIDSKMCVQDPFEHARNCSTALHLRLFQVVLKYINKSAQLFYEVESSKYLKAMLTIAHFTEDDNIIKTSKNRIHRPHRARITKHNRIPQRNAKIKVNVRRMVDQFKKRRFN